MRLKIVERSYSTHAYKLIDTEKCIHYNMHTSPSIRHINKSVYYKNMKQFTIRKLTIESRTDGGK